MYTQASTCQVTAALTAAADMYAYGRFVVAFCSSHTAAASIVGAKSILALMKSVLRADHKA
jgi:hypothetical protein